MNRLIPCLVLAVGCMPGPSEDTLVDELRVIGAIAEPPEVAPGETTAVDVVVADPLGSGAEVAVWLCTPADDGCAEAGSSTQGRVAVGSPTDGRFRADLTVDPLWAAFAGPEPIPTSIWVLACEPGVCPLFDRLGGDALDDEVEALLANPTEWVGDLPLTGVSLAVKQLSVSTRDEADRNDNPVLSVSAPEESTTGEEWLLDVTVADSNGVAEIMGLSTAGGFGLTAFEALDGQATMQWYAPDDPGEVQLYAVASDGLGGMAIWQGRAEVR